MPPPFLERLALELLRIVLLVVLVFVIVFVVGLVPAADDLELPAEQRAGRRLDRAGAKRTQQHQHIDKLELLHLARRLRIDQYLHVRRPFEQLSAVVMLNGGLARRRDFASTS